MTAIYVSHHNFQQIHDGKVGKMKYYYIKINANSLPLCNISYQDFKIK